MISGARRSSFRAPTGTGTANMGLGPVFERELLVTARRKRSFALRSIYALAILAQVASIYRAHPLLEASATTISFAALSSFGRELYQTLVVTQGIAIILLTPALVSGAIAGEVQRKTLHDLLTSDLSSAEIVLGKLAARLLHVVVLLAAGLPILLVAGLIGGLDPWLSACAVAASLSTAFFLGALSILGSTQTRSARGSLNFTMTLTLTWLILPGAVVVLMPRSGWLGYRLYDWLGPINAWIAASSPFTLYVAALGGAIWGPHVLLNRVVWMVGLQVTYGLLLTWLAVGCLRSTYRGREGASRRRVPAASRSAPSGRLAPARPECGEDPMLWKEIFAPRLPAFQRPLGVLMAIVLGVLLAWSTFDYAAPAFRELLISGYGIAPSGSARGIFLIYLRIVGVGVYVVYVLGVASDAAAGLSSEREKDTWISLVSTPLTGTEIIRAKMLGAIWGIRHTACVLIALGLVGALVGSVHPLGLAAVLVQLAVSTWFSAALGTWVSLRSEQTMGAVARSSGLLMLANVGCLLIALPLWPGHPIAYAGCTPFLIAASLVSYGDVGGTLLGSNLAFVSDAALSTMWVNHRNEMLLAWFFGAAVYAAGAAILTRSACRGFDAQLDRPVVLEDCPNAEVSEEPSARPRGLGRLPGSRRRVVASSRSVDGGRRYSRGCEPGEAEMADE